METVEITYNADGKALVPPDAGSFKVTGFYRVTDRPEFEAGTIDITIDKCHRQFRYGGIRQH